MTAIADVREGGRWGTAQRAKNDALWLLASSSLAVAERLPPSVLRVAGVLLGVLTHAVLPGARRVARANVARVFPELGPTAQRDLVRRAYRALGAHLGEAVATLAPARALSPLPLADEHLGEARREGRGVLFVSAHLGPWERVAASLVAAGCPLTVVAREAYDPRLTRIYERLRGGRGVRIIWRGSPGAAAGLLRTLRRGDVVGIPMDLASRVPSIDVPFLGTPAPTPVGPARLALRTGAAVVVGSVAPSDGGLVVTTSRIVTSDLGPGAEGERLLSTRINDALSRRIRALPESWIWMHPRWPTM
jgi:Kdo2-lipid IVA lauroyltransferase/acyltransferase